MDEMQDFGGQAAEGPIDHSPPAHLDTRVDRATNSEFGAGGLFESGFQLSSAVGSETNPAMPEAGEGHLKSEIHTRTAPPADPVIIEIREQWRRRQAWHRAEKSLTLQCKALCRRLAIDGDKGEADKIYRAALGKGEHEMGAIALSAIFPLNEARKTIEVQRKAVEKRLEKLAKQLPVAQFVIETRGVGIASLAAIVGEAGDLSNYSNPAKLWKRMGLAVMGDGQRQRRIAGDAAMEHGYSPARRSVVWNIGACIVKAGGPLKGIYDARKLYEAERVATKMHAHNRAQRYVEKRFLRLLWRAWRGGHSHVAVQAQRAAP